jgi:hypothetical protein
MHAPAGDEHEHEHEPHAPIVSYFDPASERAILRASSAVPDS